jgi:hypothetical protein
MTGRLCVHEPDFMEIYVIVVRTRQEVDIAPFGARPNRHRRSLRVDLNTILNTTNMSRARFRIISTRALPDGRVGIRIFRGQATTNPSVLIVTARWASEHASDLIQALPVSDSSD